MTRDDYQMDGCCDEVARKSVTRVQLCNNVGVRNVRLCAESSGDCVRFLGERAVNSKGPCCTTFDREGTGTGCELERTPVVTLLIVKGPLLSPPYGDMRISIAMVLLQSENWDSQSNMQDRHAGSSYTT